MQFLAKNIYFIQNFLFLNNVSLFKYFEIFVALGAFKRLYKMKNQCIFVLIMWILSVFLFNSFLLNVIEHLIFKIYCQVLRFIN